MTDAEMIKGLAEIVVRGLAEGKQVEIEPLGVFVPDESHGLRFEARNTPQVFLAYAKEDGETAERLASELESAGFSPWMDVRKLLPGQNWPRAIENAIDASNFFLACFSQNSVNKRGGFQSEILIYNCK